MIFQYCSEDFKLIKVLCTFPNGYGVLMSLSIVPVRLKHYDKDYSDIVTLLFILFLDVLEKGKVKQSPQPQQQESVLSILHVKFQNTK